MTRKNITETDPIGFARHDHRACIEGGVAAADSYCRNAGLQFTQVRRRVLEILLARHRAMGAYEILDILRDEGLGSQPPVVYRALDFLVNHGFAHRIEHLNAFAACSHRGKHHTPAFLICRVCGSVAEAQVDGPASFLGDAAAATGFDIERTVVEVEGVCPNCRDRAAK